MGTQEVITETQIKQRLLDLEEQNRKLQQELLEERKNTISLKPTLRDGSELETSYKLTLEQQDCIRSCQNTLTVIAVQSLQTNNF